MGARLFWKLLPNVREGERSRFLFFAGLLTLVAAGQTVGLAGSEALFLARVGIADLPLAFIGAAGVTVLGSMLYAARVGSTRNDTFFWQMLLGAGALLIGSTFFVLSDARWVYWALFCFWYLTMAVFLNHFWTFSGDYFDTLASKRLVPLFTLGTSVGGVLGGGLAMGLAGSAGSAGLIGAWGITLLAGAALIFFGRRRVRRWGPLELDEADETSVESMRGAVQFVRTSPLAGWLVVSALGMVLAAFLAQYLYSDIFARAYPDPEELATFLSIYFTITNVAEIFVGVALAPWLILKIGVGGANLAHPLLLLGAFGGIAFSGGMPAGIAARVAEEMSDNSLAAPVRSLMQNAMPNRLRGRVRAFLEGIVVYAGMAVAGLILLFLQKPDPLWLCMAGSAAAIFYLFANWRARRAYTDTLLSQLRAGRLDLSDVNDAIGSWESVRITDLWEDALRGDDGRPTSALLPLVPALASRGIVDPLVRAASHPNSSVRRECVTALAGIEDARLAGVLALALDDPEPSVRLAALRGVAKATRQGDFVRIRARDLCRDPDPEVRAEASLLSGPDGHEILIKMLHSPNAAESTAALAIAPAELLGDMVDCTGSHEAGVRAAALERIADVAGDTPVGADTLLASFTDADALLAFLTDADPAVRSAAVRVTAAAKRTEIVAVLGARLADADSQVRRTTETVLGGLAELGVAVAEPRLRDDSERPVEAALRVIARSGIRRARGFLHRELRYRTQRAWWYLLAQPLLPRGESAAERLLLAALRDAIVRERRLAFRILRLLETESVIRKVERELRVGSPARDQALEFLSNLGDREAADSLVALHLEGHPAERAPHAANDLDVPEDTMALLAACRRCDHPWVRMAARALAPEDGDPPPQEETMQHLLALKQIDLFANLSFEQVDAILQASDNADYLPGEIIIREGERGDTLYLLLEGSVDIILGYGTSREQRRDPITAIGYFGEMAILTDEARTATVVARDHCHLLTLDGAAFRELVRQVPEISFEIFRVLTRFLRVAEEAARNR
ncbi:MAG: cyclic nucleotide-binding domain-containing protein [Deltaproteobacteria bacterium]|nr:cyclic nucleotide-binding domain-containing protein [Deltaproteobacteria bacterium]